VPEQANSGPYGDVDAPERDVRDLKGVLRQAEPCHLASDPAAPTACVLTSQGYQTQLEYPPDRISVYR
jgi:hypothetical protein